MLNGINKYRKFLCKQNIFCVTDDPDLFTNFEKNLKLYLPSNIPVSYTHLDVYKRQYLTNHTKPSPEKFIY